jgi:hypothetical protein
VSLRDDTGDAKSVLRWLYRISMFVVTYVVVHELGHAALTVLTGGSVISITFDIMNMSGATVTTGGIPLVIFLAGFSANLLFMVLFYLEGWNIGCMVFSVMCLRNMFILGDDINNIYYANHVVGALFPALVTSISIALLVLSMRKYLGENTTRVYDDLSRCK